MHFKIELKLLFHPNMTHFHIFYTRYMYILGFLGNSLPLFQAYKIIISCSAIDVSLSGYIIFCWAVISWMIYGIIRKDKVLIATNAFATLSSIICIVTILIFH